MVESGLVVDTIFFIFLRPSMLLVISLFDAWYWW